MLTKSGLFLFLLTVLQVTARYKSVAQSAASIENDIDPEYEVVSSSSSRILSGWEAQPGQHPHHASLRSVRSTGGIGTCGGSIVSREWIITAASCTARRVTLVVRAGVVSLTNPEYISETTEWYIHPRYNEASPNVQTNDISIIKLQRPLVYSRLLRPIRVQSRADAYRNYHGQSVYTSGHGVTSNSNSATISEVLRWVWLRAISNISCIGYYFQFIIVNTTICARFANVTSQSICRGDGGAPLVHVGGNGIPTLIGVGSFWSNNCALNWPSGYTRPGPYLAWFQQVTGIDFENLQEEEETTTTTSTTSTTTTSTTTVSEEQEPEATAQPDDSDEEEPEATAQPDDSDEEEPDTTVQPDDSEEQNPDVTARPDDSEEQEPDATAQPDNSEEQEPDTTALPDDSDEQEPDATVQPDDSDEEEPEATALPDDSNEQEPDATVQPDDSEEQEPEATAQPDDSEEQEPDATAQPDDSDEQGPDATAQPDNSEEQESDTTALPDGSDEQEPDATVQPDHSEEQEPDVTTPPDDSEEQKPDVTARPDDSNEQEPDATAQPGNSEEQEPDATARPDDSEEQDSGTTAQPDDSETQKPDDSSPEDGENKPEDSEEKEEDKEEEGEEDDSDSSECNEDDEIGQLLKRLEVYVKVKVRFNKFKTKNEVGKIKHIKHH